MRPITKLTLCALTAAAMAAPAVAASDYYLKLDTVRDDSAAKASGGKQIEIESWSWGTAMTGDWDGTIIAPRDTASGMPAGKRQHGWNTVSKPLDRGSVRVKVKFPWLECRVGAAFPDAVLQNSAGRFELKDAIITGCAPDSVALDYAKVKVRAWDPAKKEHF